MTRALRSTATVDGRPSAEVDEDTESSAARRSRTMGTRTRTVHAKGDFGYAACGAVAYGVSNPVIVTCRRAACLQHNLVRLRNVLLAIGAFAHGAVR